MTTISNFTETDNDWAKNVEDIAIHISEAESGAKGYFCMGCSKEMEAVKRKIVKYKSYFRHRAKDVEFNRAECVSSSRVYREKLAYFYFMRVKQIKVPAVYKYPPKGVDGFPVLLQESKTIVADRVDREVVFFEDENGEIHWGRNKHIDDRYLMVRPDAVFFDRDNKPILFLEFVITHKPDLDKLNKLQRLGINTVQIIVPKLSEPELEKSISQVSKVKWTYNEIESNSEYLPATNGNAKGIPLLDEEQRKLFEESFKCRSAQIGNLIRSIKRSLESQSYRRVERLFEQEISRIEDATREHRTRLDEMQRGIEAEIYSELRDRREDLDRKEQQFREYASDMGDRYQARRDELAEQQRSIDRELERRFSIGELEADIREEYDRVGRELRSEFEEEDRRNQQQERATDAETTEIDKKYEAVRRAIEENTTFNGQYSELEREIECQFSEATTAESNRHKRERENIEAKIAEVEELRNRTESRIRSETEGRYQQTIERINNRDITRGDELSSRIIEILRLRGYIDGYSRMQERISEFREGTEVLRNRVWKKWD